MGYVHARMEFAIAVFVHAIYEYGHLALRPKKHGHSPHPRRPPLLGETEAPS